MSLAAKTRILVADDEPSYRMSVAMVLTKTGIYEVDEVASGEEAIQALNHLAYDLIILDHQMGGVSGLNVMQWLHEQKMQIPVIVLTGFGSDTIAAEVMKLGAYDYIRKDQLEVTRFPVLVNSTLEGYRSRLERQQANAAPSRVLRKSDITGLLENTSASFSRSAEAVIGLIADEFDEYHKRLRPNLAPSARPDVDRIMKNFQEQLKLVSLFTKTLADLSQISRAQQTPGSGARTNQGFIQGHTEAFDAPDFDTE
jgi:CheY-like chemotaxis protein